MSASIRIRFVLNGAPCEIEAPGETTLLALLRDHLGLTGTKCGCEIGQCGACTVLLNGETVASCLVLAGQVEGASIETVEGLSAQVGPDGAGLHPLQRAFLDLDAVACGFCTPGMLLAAQALLRVSPHPNREEIRRALSGNLCRCTGYLPIFEAVEKAAAGIAAAGIAAAEMAGETRSETGPARRNDEP